MTKVQIINGTYGHRDKTVDANGKTARVVVTAKTKDDGPFDLPDVEAERLVKLGVAKRADEAPGDATNAAGSAEPGARVSTIPAAPESDVGASNPHYSAATKVTELRALMKQCGLPIAIGMTKEQMAAALDAYFAGDDESGEEGVDGDAPPRPEAAGPET